MLTLLYTGEDAFHSLDFFFNIQINIVDPNPGKGYIFLSNSICSHFFLLVYPSWARYQYSKIRSFSGQMLSLLFSDFFTLLENIWFYCFTFYYFSTKYNDHAVEVVLFFVLSLLCNHFLLIYVTSQLSWSYVWSSMIIIRLAIFKSAYVQSKSMVKSIA